MFISSNSNIIFMFITCISLLNPSPFALVRATENHTSPLLVIPLIHHGSDYYRSYLLNSSYSTNDLLKSPISQNQYGFSARLQIGTRHIEQLLYVDSGSSLLWVNCWPCTLNIPEPIYDPAKSLNYMRQNCFNSKWYAPSGGMTTFCGKKRECSYIQRYADNNTNEGHIAMESLYFGYNIIRDFAFGCSASTSLFANGVMGLGDGFISILNQTSSTKFAHCIGDLSDGSYKHNTLIIGNQVTLLGNKTPMNVEGQYYIAIDGITLRGEVLEYEQRVFPSKLIIDSGSMLSFLPTVAVKALERKLNEEFMYSLVRNNSVQYNKGLYNYTRLCYSGINDDDYDYDWRFDFPPVQFLFGDGANLELRADNLFQKFGDDTICLAIVPLEVKGWDNSLLGNQMMQFHYNGV